MATAAQIIAKVRVDGVNSFTQDMRRAGQSVDSVGERAARAGKLLSGFVLTAGAGIAAGLLKLGIDAVNAAAKFEMFRVTLEALTGSAERTKAKLEFIRLLAIPSTFTFSELAQAGTQLESFRVPLEKALPLIAKLGAAFPNKEMGDFVNLFGRLGSGDFPDIEALSGAGLSKLDFIRKGIKFDSNGSLLSSSRQTMNALEAIINDRYGNILDKVANTTTAKLATVRDKWEQNLRKIGDALIRYVNPALDKLSAFLDRLSTNTNFEKFLKKAAVSFLKFGAAVFGVLAAVHVAVGLLNASIGNLAGAALNVIGAMASWAAGAAVAIGGAKALKELFKMGDNRGHWEDASRFPPGGAAIPPTPPGTEYPDNPAAAAMRGTEMNTRRTAENTEKILDISRNTLGGGNLGAMGVTPVEFGRFRNRSAVNVRVEFRPGASFEEVMADVARDAILQDRRLSGAH